MSDGRTHWATCWQAHPDCARHLLEVTLRQRDDLRAERDALKEGLSHAMCCDYPDEIDFKCAGCCNARALLSPPKPEGGDRG